MIELTIIAVLTLSFFIILNKNPLNIISSKKPAGDDWKWLYVDHDMLYRGDKNNEDGKPVLDVSYYNKKSLDDTNKKANVLKMSVTAYRSNAESSEESEFRAKFSYVFSNSDEKYTKGDTVKFSNAKSLKEFARTDNTVRCLFIF